MRTRLISDEIYRKRRDELEVLENATGVKASHAETLLYAGTDVPDGMHNLTADGHSQAQVRDGRIESIDSLSGEVDVEFLAEAVEQARLQREKADSGEANDR